MICSWYQAIEIRHYSHSMTHHITSCTGPCYLAHHTTLSPHACTNPCYLVHHTTLRHAPTDATLYTTLHHLIHAPTSSCYLVHHTTSQHAPTHATWYTTLHHLIHAPAHATLYTTPHYITSCTSPCYLVHHDGLHVPALLQKVSRRLRHVVEAQDCSEGWQRAHNEEHAPRAEVMQLIQHYADTCN